MSKYLNNLQESCQKLESIDKFTNNNTNVFSLVTPIINSFNEIKLNTNDDEVLYSALSLIINIKETKPQLKGVVDAIIEIINESYKENEVTIRRWFYVL